MVPRFVLVGAIAAVALPTPSFAQPLDHAFTFQGEVHRDGTPANGLYDLQFRLYDSAGGAGQVGPLVCTDNVPVTSGRFTVVLDFGSQFGGQRLFMQVDVRADTGFNCTNATGFTTLLPRQELTAAPHASFALTAASAATAVSAASATTAASAAQLNGQSASFYQNAANLNAGALPNARLSGTYSGALNFSSASNVFVGSGAGLTSLDASSITNGTLANARTTGGAANTPNTLVLRDGSGNFAAGSITGSFNGAHSGSGSALTGVNADQLDGLDSSVFLQGLPVPMVISGSSATHIVFAENTASSGNTFGGRFESASTAGRGVFGVATSTSGMAFGVSGQSASTSGRAVNGLATATTGSTFGGRFQSSSSSGTGVYGWASATSGTTYGVYGQSDSPLGRGVYGLATDSSSATAYGVFGESTGVFADGVFGLAANSIGVRGRTSGFNSAGVVGETTQVTGTASGVYGQSNSASGRGVTGYASSAEGGIAIGVLGESASTRGRGIYGRATASGENQNYGGYFESDGQNGYGLFAESTNAAGSTAKYGVRGEVAGFGYGVFSTGDLGASGTKLFRIDHPDDPANKYLLHYCPESPEVLNFYRGTVELDGAGEAWVELPAYFAKINKDPSYTLTAIGAPMPMLHIAIEVSEQALVAGAAADPDEPAPSCSFRIAGGAPGARVSWRVEALRNDKYVQKHGMPVEADKHGAEKGTYQHPDLYGQPAEKSMSYEGRRKRPQRVAPSPTAPAGDSQ